MAGGGGSGSLIGMIGFAASNSFMADVAPAASLIDAAAPEKPRANAVTLYVPATRPPTAKCPLSSVVVARCTPTPSTETVAPVIALPVVVIPRALSG